MDPDTLGFQHVHEPGTGPGAPATILPLHGTGADERDLLPLAREVAPGAPLLSPLGKVREDGMPRWFRRHGEGVFDEASIREQARALASFLDDARRAYPDLPDRYVALGFSNGANIAASLLLLHPGTLAGAALLRPMVPLVPETLPDLAGVPVLLASGASDPLVPLEDARELASLLGEAGAEVTHHVQEGAGHGLAREEVPLVREWIREHGFVDGKG